VAIDKSLPKVLQTYQFWGLDIKSEPAPNEYNASCPFCNHDSKKGIGHFYVNGNGF